MQVRDLIEALQRFDPRDEVAVEAHGVSGNMMWAPAQSVEPAGGQTKYRVLIIAERE